MQQQFSSSGDLTTAIAALRLRLLDLSARNHLLAFRHPRATCLRFCGAALGRIHREMVVEGKAPTLAAVPSPSAREAEAFLTETQPDQPFRLGQKPETARWAAQLGIDAELERPVDAVVDTTIGLVLQTLLYDDDLDLRGRRLRGAAAAYVGETGANALFLALGFLEWTEAGKPDKPLLAPLLLVPAEIRQTLLQGRRRYALAHTGEDIETNHCLAKKLLDEAGIVLPEVGDHDGPDAYLAAVQAAVGHREGWAIRRFASLGFFDFGKILLWRDLDPAAWPPGQGPHTAPLVAALLEGVTEEGPGFCAGDHAAEDADFATLPLVLSADATQAAALKAALSRTALVVEGPPGTGKSQTITNLIAASLARGETVLFVAEKLAALEVVKGKLARVGLDDFVLELHSHRSRKASVIGDIARRLALRPAAALVTPPDGAGAAAARLAAPASALGRRVDGERRVSDLLRDGGVGSQRLADLAPGLDAGRVDPASAYAAPETLARVEEFEGRALDMAAAGRHPSAHPWRGFGGAAIRAAPRPRLLAEVEEAALCLEALAGAFAALPPSAGLSSPSVELADRLMADGRRLERMAATGRQLAQLAAKADGAWQRCASEVGALAAGLGLPAPTRGTDIRQLNAVSDAVLAAPSDGLDGWPESLLSIEAEGVVADLGERITRHRALEAPLRQHLRAAAFAEGGPDDIASAGMALASAGFLGFLSPTVRRAERIFDALALSDVALPRAEKGRLLLALAEAKALAAEIGGHDRAAALLGAYFRGSATPIEAVARLRKWLATTRDRLPEQREDGTELWRILGRLDAGEIEALQVLSRRLEATTSGVLAKMTADLTLLGSQDSLDLTFPDAFVRAFRAAWRPGEGKLSTEVLDGFLQQTPDIDGWAEVAAAIARLAVTRAALTPVLDALRPALSAEGTRLLQAGLPLAEQTALLRAALAAPEAIDEWRRYEQRRAATQAAGLAPLVEAFEAGRLAPTAIVAAYRALVDLTLAGAEVDADPELLDFSGEEIARRRARFAEADDRRLRQTRLALRAALLTRVVPAGRTGARSRDLTELQLLRHQTGLQRAHLPIRELVRRAPAALQALKPCFMMGPISVAQYLPAGSLAFDLLIMDEASQIRPEDALGALARARRAVIVGDTRQLPPTNVFRKSFGDEDDEDAFLALGAESVLEQAGAVFPKMPLRWHYRSRHESLIAFSNSFFYGGDLVVFPSPAAPSPELGIHYQRVSGLFESGRNRIEAAAIATAAIEHLRTYPAQSLGIVAMNRDQAELIDMLLTECADEAGIDLAAVQDRPDGLFVKNLENVQGDERDVMFVSMTYGPAVQGGVVAKNFALINQSGGERRLNVLFSRARRRMVIFTSMDDGDLVVDAGTARGTQVMQAFLRYARTGILDDVHIGSGRPPDSGFEIEVAAALRARGFEVVAQVGVAGFFIDLALRDPERPGSFLLGIECDGASYHSGRCARERDRLRQARLEELGWRIERIWSTDWFVNPQHEIDRIAAKAEALRAAAR